MTILPLLLACADPRREGVEVGDCTDHADNDMDGAFDCDDDGCAGSPDCAATDTASLPTDTADTTDPLDLIDGDPILTRASWPGESSKGYEWLDASMLSSEYALLVGVSGYGVQNLSDASVVPYTDTRGYRVAASAGLAVVGSRTEPLLVLDVSDPTAITEHARGSGEMRDGSYYEDVAINSNGLVMVGWQEEGARFFGPDLSEVATFPGDDVFAVALHEERALLTDGTDLILLDVSAPSSLVELDRVSLPGAGRDLDFDGSRVAVGMGGLGVMVLAVEDDALVEQGQLTLPGTALSVALDGDYLWIGAWEVVGLAWIGEGGPVMLGHEDPAESAMGLAAGDGVAAVGDWGQATVMEAVVGTAGAEVVIPASLYFTDSGASQSLHISSGGYSALTVTLSTPDHGFSAAAQTYELAPGESASITVTPPASSEGDGTLAWTSSDPDEPSGSVALSWSSIGVGMAHEDFTLQGFTAPDGALDSYTLSAQKGPVFLAYWSSW